MSIRIRLHKDHGPAPCEHHCIVASGIAGYGRCVECGTQVATPFTIRTLEV